MNHTTQKRSEFITKLALGASACMSLGASQAPKSVPAQVKESNTGDSNLSFPNYQPKAKRLIYLFQCGAPAQQDLFDPKDLILNNHGKDMRDFMKLDQRMTGFTSGQKAYPIASPPWGFKQHGQAGHQLSNLLPHLGEVADDLCIIKSMYTEAINHDPGITFFQSGSQIPGRPSLGSWLTYALRSNNHNLPSFVSLTSRGSAGGANCQPIYDRLWSSGFLPTEYSGTKFMGLGDPVLYLNNPKGMTQSHRRKMLDHLNQINSANYVKKGDPEIMTRIKQYELAYRMQSSIPELTDFSNEPKYILDMYGPNVHKRGSYAYNCLLARRLAERGVLATQLFHRGWDNHFDIRDALPKQCKDVDQPTAALIKDLKMRGLLEDTLVIWGGEFGRTTFSQGNTKNKIFGRDHHPRCFSIFAAGAGIKPGISYGETDELSYNIVKDPIHVHDLHATLLHLFGIDHERLTYKFQGRNYRLTDVHGHLVKDILA